MRKAGERIIQYGFTVSGDGTRMVPSVSIPPPPPEKHPDWMVVSATGLLAAARIADLTDESQPRETTLQEAEKLALAAAAGTIIHTAAEGHLLFSTIRPRQKPYADDHRRRLTQLGKVLPTAPPAKVRRWRKILSDSRLALPVSETGIAEETCLNIIDGKLTDMAKQNPPLAGSLPLWPGNQIPTFPFVDPRRLRHRWDHEVFPALGAKLAGLRRWEQQNQPPIGAGLFQPQTGNMLCLPEVDLHIIVPPLGITLIRRSDRLTRMQPQGPNGPTTLEEVDFKSAAEPNVPPRDSNAETATEFLTYLLAVGLAAGSPGQDRPGQAVKTMVLANLDRPRTISPADRVSVRQAAIGADAPTEVDFARMYRQTLINPAAASDLLERAEELLDRIRSQPDLRSVAQVRKRR